MEKNANGTVGIVVENDDRLCDTCKHLESVYWDGWFHHNECGNEDMPDDYLYSLGKTTPCDYWEKKVENRDE